ncbi:organic cation/carnitine transporter 4-like [Iris pallida]|uniref:H(+)/Pi cotransporter n=1 Tax=Iris pallida TaxID=29817 RepID=A0AAX6E5U9_IRIPA|nr:organic cation/carnitine transporter 4-like [Iris pallida]
MDATTSSMLTSALLPGRDPADGREVMGFDETLSRYAGEFGPWQLRQFLLASLGMVVYAFHTLVMIFADREPAGVVCQCASEAGPGSWEWVGGRGASTVAEWGLVCGERFKIGLVQSVFFAGCMIGCGLFGHLSDSFLGRKGTLTMLCVMGTIFGSLTAASPSYIAYVALRFLTGVSAGAMAPCSFVLATEPIGPRCRAAAGMSIFYFFSVGIVVLSALAYFIPSWRVLYLVSSLPALLFLLLVLPFVSESPRWHLVRGNHGKAMAIVRSIAERNGRRLPVDDKLTLVLDSGTSQRSNAPSPNATIIDVFRSPTTRWRLVTAVATNFLCAIVYYGVSLNVTNLSTSVYISTAANAVAEVPGYALTALFLDRLGRRPLLVGTMWLSGGFCVAGSFLGSEGWGRTACSMFGIFGMAAAFNLLLIYAAELFPTVVRNAALGCLQQALQTGAIAAPMAVTAGGEGRVRGVRGLRSCRRTAGILPAGDFGQAIV